MLENGLDQLELSPTHIVVRGTGQSDSIRCEWHGVARTTDHREDTIRYWLGLDDNDDLPSPSDAKTKFMTYVHGMSPRYQETWAANLDALAKGGMTKDILFLACYIDYTTQEYILGSGSGPITVGYDQMAESTSFELYSRAHAAGQFRNEALMTEGEYQDHLKQIGFDAEALADDIIGGHETVVFPRPHGFPRQHHRRSEPGLHRVVELTGNGRDIRQSIEDTGRHGARFPSGELRRRSLYQPTQGSKASGLGQELRVGP